MTKGPTGLEERFCEENQELLDLLIQTARRYREAGDANMLIMMAAALDGTVKVLRGIVETEAVFVKELTLEDCIGKR